MKIIVGVFTILCLFGCTNTNDTINTLSNAGYTNIDPGGYSVFSCARDDFYSTKFTATNPLGKKVEGVFCSGLFFKGSTIRF